MRARVYFVCARRFWRPAATLVASDARTASGRRACHCHAAVFGCFIVYYGVLLLFSDIVGINLAADSIGKCTGASGIGVEYSRTGRLCANRTAQVRSCTVHARAISIFCWQNSRVAYFLYQHDLNSSVTDMTLILRISAHWRRCFPGVWTRPWWRGATRRAPSTAMHSAPTRTRSRSAFHCC